MKSKIPVEKIEISGTFHFETFDPPLKPVTVRRCERRTQIKGKYSKTMYTGYLIANPSSFWKIKNKILFIPFGGVGRSHREKGEGWTI